MKFNDQAIIWGSRSISYQRLEGYISSATKLLKGRGIGAQDRLALIGPNSVEYVIVLLALWRMGVVACPLNPNLPPESIAQCLATINPKAIITSATPEVAQVNFPIIHFGDLISFDARQTNDTTYGLGILGPSMDQISTIIWTSGSNSQPKAAVHTWGNHVYNAQGSQEVIPLKSGDRWILSLPLFHVSGISIVVRCILAGATIVIPSEEDLAVTIQKVKVTHVSLVVTQLYRLLNNFVETQNFASLGAILLGGSTISSSLMEKALDLGLPIYISYGLTEMSSQVATGRVKTSSKPYMHVLPHRQLKIDTDGQILVKGDTLFKGYLQYNKIFLPLDEDGWFKTGDLGKLDDNGCLSVSGRVDNMFICAGENIQPEEIEQVLLKMREIEQAVVVPREDKEYGYRPVAFIQMASRGRTCSARTGESGFIQTEQIIHHCQKYLPKIKIPVTFYPWPDDGNQGIKMNRQAFQVLLAKEPSKC